MFIRATMAALAALPVAGLYTSDPVPVAHTEPGRVGGWRVAL